MCLTAQKDIKMSNRHSAYHIVGKKIGHALVMKDLGTINKAKRYLVRCFCGNMHVAYGNTLMMHGENNSQYQCKLCKKDSSRLLKIQIMTDMESKALYEWKKLTRIVYPFNDVQKKFSLCTRWHDFFLFLHDMNEPKLKDSLIKLKNGIGEYNKNNCVWIRTSEFRAVRHCY